MKIASMIAGVVGVLLILGAIYGRLHGPPTIWLLGHACNAGSCLLLANSVLLVAILLGVLGLDRKS